MRKSLPALLFALVLLLASCGSTGAEVVETADTAAAEVPSGDEARPGNGEDGGDPADGEGIPQEPTIDPADGEGIPREPTTGTLRSALLGRTLDRSRAVSSARFDVRISLVGAPGSDLPGETTLTVAGAYDLAQQASKVSMDFGDLLRAAAEAEAGGEDSAELAMFAGFFEEPLEVITIGERSWIRWGLLSLFTGTEGKWLEGEPDETEDMAAGLGFGGTGSPTELLEWLAEADASVEELGREDVRGAPTTRYRAVVDAAALVETMSPAERAELEAEIGAMPVAELPMDLWIDDAGLLHRYVLDLSDPALLDDADGDLESAVFTVEFWDHGADVAITPPPPDQVVSEDEIDLDFGAFADLGG